MASTTPPGTDANDRVRDQEPPRWQPPATSPPETRPPRRGVPVIGWILVGLGVWLLLDRLGYVLPDPVGRLFWPIALIAIGVLLLFRRVHGVIIGVAIAIATLLIAVAVFGALATGGATVEDVRVTAETAEDAEINLSTGIGGLDLESGALDGALVEGTVTVPRGRELIVDERVSDATAIVDIDTRGSGFPFFRFWSDDDIQRSRLRVTDAVPVALAIDTGVGESDLDLRDLSLERLNLSTGVGRTEVILADSGRYDATIDGGVGEIVVHVPEGLGVRLVADTGIGNVEIAGPWRQTNGAWESEGWENADTRVELNISTGVGKLRVDEVE